MKRQLALLALIACLAGCPRDEAATSAQAPQPAAAGSATGSAPRAPAPAGFARLPDRGELLAYARAQPATRMGAYTWHRAELSEAHALRAMFEGELRLRAPSGEALAFQYERHVEHPGGDWTWVGRLRGGQPSDRVILTFGAKASFGSIAQPGKPALRLTTRGGSAWLVETDAAALAQMALGSPDRARDYRVPPKTAGQPPQATTSTAAAVVAAATTVDLVIGYTAGFAAGLGGQSQALTRLNHLVDVNNQAYRDSQLDAQVRLVHAMQVSYADGTDNEVALTDLTGHTGSGTAPVPAALQALRQARETHGADLVSLVRKYDREGNNGCGIAWLIGGGRTGIDRTDASFGYSVVSDGVSQGGDGRNYYCRDETLAHELGHNLGSQHDRATATEDGDVSYGAFTYSFGYKVSGGAGNFHTIMAYGDAGQPRHGVFSNPRISFCGGLPCGIADQADNARSMVQTLPIIATFRATVTPTVPDVARVRGDVDGDGRTDLLFHNATLARFAAWLMNGGSVVANPPGQAVGAGYAATATGDFNGDGKVDLAWTNAEGRVYAWIGNGGGFTSTLVKTLPAGWGVAGAGDVNGDGRDDLLLHNAGRALFGWWLLDGARITGEFNQLVGPGYRVAATGDFDGNGRVDLAWTNAARTTYLWLGTGSAFSSAQIATPPAGWEFAAAGDVDGDGRDDLLLHNAGSTSLGWWLMSGRTIRSQGSQAVGAGYTVATTGDFDGNGRVDVLWSNPQRLQYLWLGTGQSFGSRRIADAPSGWRVVR